MPPQPPFGIHFASTRRGLSSLGPGQRGQHRAGGWASGAAGGRVGCYEPEHLTMLALGSLQLPAIWSAGLVALCLARLGLG